MAFCRSWKIGNCSDYSQNRLLHEKAPETSLGGFPVPGSPALCGGRWGVASTHGNGEVPAWHRSSKPFFLGLCMRGPCKDGTEDGGALNGIVCPWRSSKRGRAIPGYSPRCSAECVSDRWPDFDCVSVTVWPCRY